MDLSTLTLDELERHFTANGDDEKAKLIRRCLDAVADAKTECKSVAYDEGYDIGYEAGYTEGLNCRG